MAWESVGRWCGIYKIVCNGNGKAYYGSTKNWQGRRATHRWALRKEIHHCRWLQNCWNKYGEAAFEFVWLENIPEGLLAVAEQKYLDKAKNKLNMATDAERAPLGRKHTEEWKRDHAAKVTGKKWSAERRASYVSPNKGRKATEATLEKMRAHHRETGRVKGDKNPFFGKPRPAHELRQTARRKQLKSKGYFWQESTGRWRVSWSCDDGKRRSWQMKTEQEAIAKVAELKQTLLREAERCQA